MSNSTISTIFSNKMFTWHAAAALATGMMFGANFAQAATVNVREFQAFGYEFQLPDNHRAECRKPNGAEILAGFFGSNERVNTRTGELCAR